MPMVFSMNALYPGWKITFAKRDDKRESPREPRRVEDESGVHECDAPEPLGSRSAHK